MTTLCRLCGGPVRQSPRGRPRLWCSATCRRRAHVLRGYARQALEAAVQHDELAAETRAGRLRSYGNVKYLERRAAELRAHAAGLLQEAGEQPQDV